ncbi:MAG: Xaa-Pro peptidase family protein [Chloroflexota bacterium]
MKSDLDRLMRDHQLDAILVTGPTQHNPAMYYMTGGGHMTHAYLIKGRNNQPVLYYNSMERDEAANTGLITKNLNTYDFKALLEDADGDQIQAAAKRYQLMLTDQGITQGRMAIYGLIEAGASYAVFTALGKLMPDLEIVGELDNSLLLNARETKDQTEIDHMRAMGKITTTVVGKTADFLKSHKAKDKRLIKADGQPLTIGEVKRMINLWLAEEGAENPKGTIFAIGRDAGVPHSAGNSNDHLELGKTIVFDIFPCQAGGGYFYDFTRTWCLGYAPDNVQALYDDVLNTYQTIMNELKINASCASLQNRTCELFEALGHRTVKGDPTTQEGYVHNLSHGLGLDVHEQPSFSRITGGDNILAPGTVITIEPGLYYPEQGMGCRLEDTVWARPDGQFEILADYPLDLVLPIEEI